MLKNIALTKSTTLSRYISHINSIPLLQEEEERHLLIAFHNGNQTAGKKVAEAHLRIVVKIALEFKNYYNNLWDIISEGNIGLLKALKNFSLEKGVRFVTYANLWVKASIQEFVLRSASMLKINIGQMQKKIMFNLGKVKAELAKYSNGKPSTKEIAKILQVPESEIMYITEATSSANNSLNEPQNSNDETTSKADFVASPLQSPEDEYLANNTQQQYSSQIQKAFIKLNDREKYIITHRFLTQNQLTLSQIATKFNISIERVRQIEAQSLQKMRKCLAV